jgi:hypothetical protein
MGNRRRIYHPAERQRFGRELRMRQPRRVAVRTANAATRGARVFDFPTVENRGDISECLPAPIFIGPYRPAVLSTVVQAVGLALLASLALALLELALKE